MGFQSPLTSSSLVVKDFIDINGSPPSSSFSDKNHKKNCCSAEEKLDDDKELFIGGTSLKLTQEEGLQVHQVEPTVDLLRMKSFRMKNSDDAAGISTTGKAKGNRKKTDDVDAEKAFGGSGGRGRSRRGTPPHISPWGRRDYFGASSRPPSFLERSLLPELKYVNNYSVHTWIYDFQLVQLINIPKYVTN